MMAKTFSPVRSIPERVLFYRRRDVGNGHLVRHIFTPSHGNGPCFRQAHPVANEIPGISVSCLHFRK